MNDYEIRWDTKPGSDDWRARKSNWRLPLRVGTAAELGHGLDSAFGKNALLIWAKPVSPQGGVVPGRIYWLAEMAYPENLTREEIETLKSTFLDIFKIRI